MSVLTGWNTKWAGNAEDMTWGTEALAQPSGSPGSALVGSNGEPWPWQALAEPTGEQGRNIVIQGGKTGGLQGSE